jgi:diadenosine tetraphosphate (Ap4A) HIT family hydrolase
MNETIRRFGHPDTLIAEYAHWVVLLRPEQPTLGSLVLAAKSEATAFSALEPAAFAELATISWHIESALERAVGYARINYLMLMMVDPNVHFHVIPRYEGSRSEAGVEVSDKGWPKAPALGEAVALTPAQIDGLGSWLKSFWPDPTSTR